MTTHVERKETRIVARTSTEVQEFIQRAADYSGATVSQFLVEAAMDRARNIIERSETLRLSAADVDVVLAAMDRPPKVNDRLRQAAKRYKENINAVQARKSAKES